MEAINLTAETAYAELLDLRGWGGRMRWGVIIGASVDWEQASDRRERGVDVRE